MPWILLLLACAPALRFPGPTGVVGRDLPSRPGFATPAPAPSAAPSAPLVRAADRGWQASLVAAAEHYLDHAPPTPFGDDCSGYVGAVIQRAGDVTLRGGTRWLWARAESAHATHQRALPHVGDLAFFDQTYDSNGNGRFDDELTHVAIVIDVDEHGTITLAHGGTGSGRTTLVMNLKDPHAELDASGARINENLRRPRRGDPASARYLASELWRGFATLRPDALDAWSSS